MSQSEWKRCTCWNAVISETDIRVADTAARHFYYHLVRLGFGNSKLVSLQRLSRRDQTVSVTASCE